MDLSNIGAKIGDCIIEPVRNRFLLGENIHFSKISLPSPEEFSMAKP
jgi:hypothetical protein